MLVPFEQSLDLAAKYRCSRVVECNNGNLGVGYKLVEMDLENSNRLEVERLLIGGTLLSLIIRAHRLIRLWH